MEIKEVEALKQRIDSINERLIYAKSQVESAKIRQQEILKEHDCETLEALRQVCLAREQQLQVLVNAANKYIDETLPVLEKIEAMTKNAYYC